MFSLVEQCLSGRTCGQQLESIEVDRIPGEQARQELVVYDVRELCGKDTARVLEQQLGVPVRVDATETLYHAVVLTQEHRVDGGQARLLGRASVALQRKIV